VQRGPVVFPDEFSGMTKAAIRANLQAPPSVPANSATDSLPGKQP